MATSKVMKFLSEQKLVVMIISGAALGFLIGILINEPIQKLEQPDRYTAITIIGFPGELLIRMLKLLILPLITCSLIVGLANLDSRVSGKIGGRAIVYYLSTTCMAAILGLVLVSAIKPGESMARPTTQPNQQLVRLSDSFLDIARNMIPSNILKACIQQDKTEIKEVKTNIRYVTQPVNTTGLTSLQIDIMLLENKLNKTINKTGDVVYTKSVEKFDTYKIGVGLQPKGNANFLGVIVFAIAVGIVAGRMGSEAEVFVKFLSIFNNIVTQLVMLAMWYSPIGIMSLIIARFAEMEDVAKTFESLGLFIVTVVVGIAIHGLILLPLLFFAITRSNPYVYLKGVTAAMATAFGTDSSAATLPVTIMCLEDNLHLDKRITRFILPVGTTINMDGTALYEAVSAIFIAQAVGRSLSAGDYIVISFTSILASVGAAAIPHAGLVTMLIVLDTVGLPSDMVAVIFSVDWFLDRLRTTINVLGDAFGTGIVQHLSKADLASDDEKIKNREKHHLKKEDSNEHIVNNPGATDSLGYVNGECISNNSPSVECKTTRM
ncbi:excitatory amino acid transporter-like isoform X1 [Hydractinia symbiolongicarpus]|uniref:excitatory amino acid transporter-like isoform X1 n=1 Tax=Hydractinia symbiolongicarpus TaxID=13093 RepID=UPI00254C3BEA|nr:excitatory amino acid transporter-like isoform X1 [Hydractinia symbiolongicarpus]XP_057314299.1 excitatory amino acid transporter-like isoform X1 [Hydractinia symbiolongicarpus]